MTHDVDAIYDHGAFVYVCDLGTDDIFIYQFDAANGSLTPGEPKSGRVPAGSGPRHLAFHPHGGFAFVNGEMASDVTSFVHDAADGVLMPIHTLSTIPEGTKPESSASAEIHCHPNGKFLYVSNRGHDSIAVFSIAADGKLTLVEIADACVKVPRGQTFEGVSGKELCNPRPGGGDVRVNKACVGKGTSNIDPYPDPNEPYDEVYAQMYNDHTHPDPIPNPTTSPSMDGFVINYASAIAAAGATRGGRPHRWLSPNMRPIRIGR